MTLIHVISIFRKRKKTAAKKVDKRVKYSDEFRNEVLKFFKTTPTKPMVLDFMKKLPEHLAGTASAATAREDWTKVKSIYHNHTKQQIAKQKKSSKKQKQAPKKKK